MIFFAKYFIYLAAVLGLVGFFGVGKKEKVKMAVDFVLTAVLAFLFSWIGGKLYYDPRPFVVHHITPLVAHAADNGFPSDHATLSFLTALVVLHYNKTIGWIMIAVSLLIGISRVYVSVHSPIDIIGGMAIGGLAYLITLYFSRGPRFYRSFLKAFQAD